MAAVSTSPSPKVSWQEALAMAKQKQRATYEAEYAGVTPVAGGPAWEIDADNNRFVDHASKIVFTTPTQILANKKDPNWAADLAASGLVLDDAILQSVEALAAAQRSARQAQAEGHQVGTVVKRLRHFGNHLCIVAKKAAEHCLQESGKWPKSLETLCQHCNVLVPMLETFPHTIPEVAQVIELHNLCCELSQKVYGDDASWPATARQIVERTPAVESVLRLRGDDKAPDETGPRAPKVVTDDPRQAAKSRNRAVAFILRLKKLLKKCLPMCLRSLPGWVEKVAELATVLKEIERQQIDIDPTSKEQQWLDRLMAETAQLCESAPKDDPAWQEHAKILTATLAETEAQFPNPTPPPTPVLTTQAPPATSPAAAGLTIHRPSAFVGRPQTMPPPMAGAYRMAHLRPSPMLASAAGFGGLSAPKRMRIG